MSHLIAACNDIDPASLRFGMLCLMESTIFPHGSSKTTHLYVYHTVWANIIAKHCMVHNSFQRSAMLMGLRDRLIVLSEAIAHSMRRRGVAGGKIRVVGNGTLGSPRFRPIRDYQLPALRGKAIITVAGMYQRKGIAELIAAFEGVASRFREAHLYLVGDKLRRGKTKWQKLAVQNLEVYTVNHVAEETKVVCRGLL
jgi:glycosyltransferase involved in cell wall biosynthesis